MNKVGVTVFVGFLAAMGGLVVVSRKGHGVGEGGRAQVVAASAAASSVAPVASANAVAPSEPEDLAVPSEEGSAEEVAAAGSAAPLLAGAPKSLTFGVVLVTYAGAQGAPRTARSRVEAEKLAAELAELAKKDFAAAVKKGDSGSTDDAGKMYQGILEPGPEVALFTLEPEHVAGPVDTPRGFWIVRRIK